MVNIEKGSKRAIDWEAIRAEYIAGGISQRKLAAKYGISPDGLMQRANRERWRRDRDEMVRASIAKTQQKVAEQVSDNAATAARIKAKLLQKLEREIDALPDLIGSETRNSMTETDETKKGRRIVKEASKAYKLRDLTAAYRELTADMVTAEPAGSELLQSLLALERRAAND